MIRLRIDGMTCGSCVARVERVLGGVAGVSRARVNLATETAVVEAPESVSVERELLEAVRRAGYDAGVIHRGGRDVSDLERAHDAKSREQRRAFIQAFSLAVPIMALHYLGPKLQSGLAGGAVWPLAMEALLTGLLMLSSAGAPILAGGVRAIIHRTPNMDLLLTIGVSVAFVSGLIGFFVPRLGGAHFHAVAMILTFINLGRYFEFRARGDASAAVAALVRLMPRTARRVTADGVEEVDVERIRPGDLLRVAVDSVIPVDGRLIDGEASVDQSAVTGESVPKHRRVGDSVYAGSVVRAGLVTMEATRVGEDSTMGRIIRAVEDAQVGATRMQRLADRVAGVFVPLVLMLALAAFTGGLVLAGDSIGFALRRAVAVLVIACPCAMGLATPTAVLVATGTAGLRGILIRDAAALEAAGVVNIILLDKTGTLTTGTPHVTQVLAVASNSPQLRASAYAATGLPEPRASACAVPPGSRTPDEPSPDPDPSRTDPPRGPKPVVQDEDPEGAAAGIVGDAANSNAGLSADEVLHLAASAEQYTQHPLGRAIVARARDLNMALTDPESFANSPGRGVVASINGHAVRVGSLSFLGQGGVDIESLKPDAQRIAGQGESVIGVAIDRECVGLIGVADTLRPAAAETVKRLKRLGVATAMVTGDQRETAQAVASAVGISEVHAGMLPEAKLAEVRNHQEAGRRVAFVGDGINDAPALAAADTGITFASATDVAAGAADVTILHDRLDRLVDVILLARKSVRIIKQNLFWAFFYNVIALPLAATGHVPPGIAAAAMMGSSISVVLNSLRLRTTVYGDAA